MEKASTLARGLALMLAFAASSASARPSPWELGTLTCSLANETSAAPGQPGLGREVICHFRPGDRGAEETYVGTIQFVGRDGVFPGGGTVMMIVKAPEAATIVAGLLEQTYSAEVSTAGKQAALVGQKDESIILRSASTSEPLMALSQPIPAMIIALELKLRSSPA